MSDKLNPPNFADIFQRHDAHMARIAAEKSARLLVEAANAPKASGAGAARRHAENRESVLRAAVFLLWNRPRPADASELANMIEREASTFWPETGEPPLRSEGLRKLLREVVKTGRAPTT